ncbi:putative regulatory protein [Pillotina sp. SPG140]
MRDGVSNSPSAEIVSIAPTGIYDSTQYRVKLSDGSYFIIKGDYFNDSLLKGTIECLQFAEQCSKADNVARRLIARSEQCSVRLAHKLKARGFPPLCIQNVIEQLENHRLIDDNRYALLWLGARMRHKSDSPRQLYSTLCNRGIAPELASKVLKECLNRECEYTLLKAFLKKHPMCRRLRHEGFSSTAINRLREEGYV